MTWRSSVGVAKIASPLAGVMLHISNPFPDPTVAGTSCASSPFYCRRVETVMSGQGRY